MTGGKKLPQYIAAVIVCIAALGAGTSIGWTSNIITKLHHGELNHLKISDDNLEWTASLLCVGAVVMCMPIGWVADTIGRKPTCLIIVIPFAIGWVLITAAQHISMVYIGRFLTGLSTGAICIMAPLYASEICETEIRGTLGSFLQLFIATGILFSNLIGKLLSVLEFNLVCLAIPIIFGILFLFQPETPVYDIRKGRKENAEKSYRRLRGGDYDFTGELSQVETEIRKEQTAGNFWEGIRTRAAKKAMIICFHLMFLQQFSGINAVMFFTEKIFIDSEIEVDHGWCVVMIGCVGVAGSLVSSIAMEITGRKPLLYFSLGSLTIFSFLLGLFFSLKDRKLVDAETASSIGWLPLTSCILYVFTYAAGMGPIPWLASAEMFPPSVKAGLSSVAATLNWFFAFLITRFFKTISDATGCDVPFYCFMIVCAYGVCFVFFFVPETKNKSFQEIVDELSR